jgi:phosphoribosyl 1,2-cyclic phosphodiesterase
VPKAKAKGLSRAEFTVRFWGVRGSIPCPGAAHARYGGNTSCLEVRCGGDRLIFDAGTGIYELGLALEAEASPIDADIFLTHTHYDHVWGWPHFTPLLDARNRFRVHAGHLEDDWRIEDVMLGLLADPLNSVNRKTLKAGLAFDDFRIGDTLKPGPGIALRTAALNHPNRAVGYRVEHDGRSICYVTDTEHRREHGPDRNVLGLIEGADLVVYDATYTDAEYGGHVGWGHSTWQEGVHLCDAARVKTYVVFHHDPGHDDAFMDKVAAELEKARPGSIVAREGMVLSP